MKILKIMIVVLIFIMSIGSVCAGENSTDDVVCMENSQNEVYTTNEASFTNLTDEIENAGTSLDLNQDYAFNNVTDKNTGIFINKDNFILNGNGHTIDGKNQSRIFNISGNNITINNLIFINGNMSDGDAGAIFSNVSITLNNVKFANNQAKYGGAISTENNLTINNATFTNNQAKYGGAIYARGNIIINNTTLTNNQATSYGGAIYVNIGTDYKKSKVTINNIILGNNKAGEQGNALSIDDAIFNLKNATIISDNELNWGLFYLGNSLIYIENTTFANITSNYSSIIYSIKTSGKIINCDFVNLTALKTGGAIIYKSLDDINIENCNFINVKSQKNGGVICAEAEDNSKGINVVNTTFINCNSEFGGVILQLNGKLNIEESKFINNNAGVSAGAIYTSLTNFTLKNSEFINNSAFKNGGAIYAELSNLTIDNVCFIGNKVENSSLLNPCTIYAYDSSSYIKNSFFNNSKYSISSFFTVKYLDENNTVNNDEFSWDNKIYPQVVVNEGIKIELINNSIDVANLPAKFDLREWGWVSPVKDQLDKGYCWVFGTLASLESALLKATGVEYDFSENNIGNNGIIYSRYGNDENIEGGLSTTALGFILNWFGPIPEEYDTYDEKGKISDVIFDVNKIHVQDAVLIPVKKTADRINSNETNNLIKQAILKYGAVAVMDLGDGQYFDDDVSIYHKDIYQCNHLVSLVGWDDNYSKDKFNITPPGDGAWILKNSWGTDIGENGYQYISYYDTTLLTHYKPVYGIAFIFENTENYKYNYQTDLMGLRETDKNYTYYSNEYTAISNNLLGGVGTYFNDSNIDYELKIYVNDELKITQNGTSEFPGFKTIKLNEYIPVKENDTFKVVLKNNMIPYQFKSRQHYKENTSFVSSDGENWIDYSSLNRTVCLKVYAFDLPIYTQDLVKIYKNESNFVAEIDVANETVTFEINGRNYTRVSDENGAASIAINLNPGNYTIKTTYNNNTVENTITVFPTLIADNLVKYFKNESQFYISLIDGQGKSVPGVNITMNINGVFYNRTTNENGTAKLNINLLPGEYILTAIDPLTGLQMSYNITVLPTLNATDLEMKYKDGSTFNVSVLDGKENPLAEVGVTFNINGVFYTRYTDSKGIAKLNINLMAGEYIITSEYDEMKIANTITIKD